jgi:hypothetical protein
MDEIRLSMKEATLILGAATGFLLGLVPLIVGIIKKRIGTGLIGLITATAGGALAGVLISIPAMAVFTWLILRDQLIAADKADPQSEPDSQETKEN